MARFSFEYEDDMTERKISYIENLYRDLSEVLETFSVFLKSIGYDVDSLIDIENEKEYFAVEQFLQKYRQKEYNNE